MPSNDVLWFKLDKELVASFAEADLVDFNWDDYVKYDEGQEIKLKARNVSYEMNGKKTSRNTQRFLRGSYIRKETQLPFHRAAGGL